MKRISLGPRGNVVSDGSACIMWRGSAWRTRFDNLETFGACIGALESNETISLGALREDLPDVVRVTTKDRLGSLNDEAAPDLIARTATTSPIVSASPHSF
jgi:hypothetical protein